jgi:hypothetical protein
MKTTILALTTLALAGAGLQNAAAGDHEWATAGKVLTGVLAGTVLVKALEGNRCPPPTCYVAPAPVVVQPAPVVAAPAVVVAPPPAPVYYTPAYYVAPAPVVAAAPPTVVYAPRPAIVVNVGFGGRPYYVRPHRDRW